MLRRVVRSLIDLPRIGRVVVLADSGFIGSAGTTRPGPGLIEQGDNLRFVLNTIAWLVGANATGG